MRIIILLFLVVLNFNSFSQVKYEPGYFITNSGEKVNCFIRNNDWVNNPSRFQYRISENSNVQTAELNDVKEFGVLNSFKFKRFNVNIDYSSDNIETMSHDPMPQFKLEVLFLKVLVEGKGSLFSYERENIAKYFFSLNDSDPQQLVHKKYLYSGNQITENNTFRKQLQSNFPCEQLSFANYEKLNYNAKDLVNFFIGFNNCEKSAMFNYNKKTRKNLFNLTIKPAVNFTSLVVRNNSISHITTFKSEISPRIGLEAEYTLPFNKNAWSLIMEPSYQYYKSSISDSIPSKALYETFELNIGVRHSFFPNDKSKVYLNAMINYYFPFNSEIFSKKYLLKTKPNNNYILGVGYKYERYSIELQYGLPREILYDYGFFKTDYKVFSILMGYNLFKPAYNKNTSVNTVAN